MVAMAGASKGAVKQAKTRARSAAMISWGVLCGASTTHLMPGRMRRISLNKARSSSMEVLGLVMVMAKDRARMHFSAATGPAANSTGTPAVERRSTMV